MQQFYFHFKTPLGLEEGASPFPFASAEAAYLDACTTFPTFVSDMLRQRVDPADCAALVCDENGSTLFEITCTDLLGKSGRPSSIDCVLEKAYDEGAGRGSKTHQRALRAHQALQSEMDRSKRLIAEAEVTLALFRS